MEEDVRSVELKDNGMVPLKGPNGELEVPSTGDQVFSFFLVLFTSLSSFSFFVLSLSFFSFCLQTIFNSFQDNRTEPTKHTVKLMRCVSDVVLAKVCYLYRFSFTFLFFPLFSLLFYLSSINFLTEDTRERRHR